MGMVVNWNDLHKFNHDNEWALGSDIVVCCINYTKENHHFIDKCAFDQMKDGAWFVNTSRGECVDSRALIDALESGKLRSAAVDVIENEQDDIEENPLIQYATIHDNLIITPHIAGCTVDSQRKAMVWAIKKLREIAGV